MKNTNGNNDMDTVEKLLAANPDITPAPALKMALAQFRAEQDKAAAEQALARLRETNNVVAGAVARLKATRKQEAKERKLLTRLVEAQKNYVASGDWDAYVRAYHDACHGL